MRELPGFSTTARLHQSAKTEVWRGLREADGRRVIIKRPRELGDRSPERARVQLEYEVLLQLRGLDGVVQVLELIRTERGPALILADSGMAPMKQLVGRLELRRALRVAAGVARALEGVHARGVIHKDINPANVLVHPDSAAIELIDFGIASRLSTERQRPGAPSQLEGTLRYIAPEQTGRTSRSVDWRSDLYSLGMSLYELICGRPPFESTDPAELVHSAIARRPLPPHALDPTLPRAVSDILMRLLEKPAEARYQSASGLASDLETCAARLDAGGHIGYFELGRRDISSRFRLPQKLYAREAEQRALFEAFEEACEGSVRAVLITGAAGVGKSSLIGELRAAVLQRRAYFAAGSSTHLRDGPPYTALLQALRDLIRQLLTEPDERLARWRERLREALGPSARIVVDVIPELELIIGPQPPPSPLPPAASRSRFDALLERLIRAFPRGGDPLVLSLDDLQWAGGATLDLIRRLLRTPDRCHLLIVGAARGDSPAARLGGEAEGAIREIALGPLPPEALGELVADTLHRRPAELAELIYQRTGGNPLFARQYLEALHAGGLIHFDPAGPRWRWSIEQVAAAPVSESIAELLEARLGELPPETRGLLSVAACLGRRFELSDLCAVGEQSLRRAARDLWPALRGELIRPMSADYKLALATLAGGDGEEPAGDPGRVRFEFTHDRIRAAARAALGELARQRVHLRIGRRLLSRGESGDRPGGLIEAAAHMNRGAALLSGDGERAELAALNLEAGRRAMATKAYDSAWALFASGRGLLPPDAPERHRPLWWALHIEGAEAALLRGAWEDRARLCGELLERARGEVEELAVLELEPLELQARYQVAAAWRASVRLLRRLGVDLPESPGPRAVALSRVAIALGRARVAIGRRGPRQLAALGACSEPAVLSAMRLLNACASSAYYLSPALIPMVMLRMVELSVRRGLTPSSAYAFAGYGFLITASFDDVETGRAYADLAWELIERFGARELEPRVAVLDHGFVHHRHAHLRESLAPFRRAWRQGLELGDQEYAALAGAAYVAAAFLSGSDLALVERECAHFQEAIARLNQERSLSDVLLQRQVVAALRDTEREPEELLTADGTHLDRAAFMEAARRGGDLTGPAKLRLFEVMLACLFGSPEQARAAADRAEALLSVLPGAPQVPLAWMYCALGWLMGSPDSRRIRRAERCCAMLEKWERHGPENCRARRLIVRAELDRVAGRELEAMRHYEAAIAAAAASGLAHEEALALERAGLQHLDSGRHRAARSYLADAVERWLGWGAAACARRLRSRCRDQLGELAAAPEPGAEIPDPTLTLSDGSLPQRDEAAVHRACLAVAEERSRNGIARRAAELMVSLSGAERGALLLTGADGALSLAAEVRLDGEAPPRGPIPLSRCGDQLPLSVINYVKRTHQEPELRDPTTDTRFARDPYLLRARPRSVHCRPLLHRGRLSGVIYLEHSGMPQVFQREQARSCQLLCDQVAVSLARVGALDALRAELERQGRLTRSYARYVPHELLELLERDGEGEVVLGESVELELTLLRAVLRPPPEAVGDELGALNALLLVLGPLIRDAGGLIDRYGGGALTAIFPDEIREAIAAARAIRAAARDRGWSAGVALHCGVVLLALTGEPIRLEVALMGPVAADARRLQGLAGERGGVLISRAVAERAGLRGEALQALGPCPGAPHMEVLDLLGGDL